MTDRVYLMCASESVVRIPWRLDTGDAEKCRSSYKMSHPQVIGQAKGDARRASWLIPFDGNS